MAIEQNGNYSPSERLVSPGVFTREIDQSYLAQGVAAIGGVVVAPFNKGPGFSPTVVRSEADLVSIFGDTDGTLYGPITAQQYIRQQGQVTICRVGGLSGYEQAQALCISAVPGQYTRDSEISAFTGSLIGAPIPTTVNVGVKEFLVAGTLMLTFDAGINSGSTVVVGDISFNTLAYSNTANITTSSYDVFSSVTLTSSLSLSNVAIPYQGTLKLQAGTVISMITTSGCQAEMGIVGQLSGSYGNFDPTSFIDGVSLSENACGSSSYVSGSAAVVLAVLANTALDRSQNLYGFSGSLLTSSSVAVGADFSLFLKEAHLNDQNAVVTSSYGTYNFSLDAGSTKYITSVFGSDPTAGYVTVPSGQKVEAAYIYKIFKHKMSQIVDEMLNDGTWRIVVTTRDAMTFADGIEPSVGTSLFDLTNAYTPFIQSQLVSTFNSGSVTSSAAYELFKVHTLSDGTPTNTQYKIEIANVKSAGSVPGSAYGSFSLVVRNYSDSDAKPVIVERYDNCNLDINSSNYVARRVGDTWNYIDFNGKIVEYGDYPNKSKTIRVEMSTAPWPVESIPFGFGPYAAPFGGELARLGKFAAMQYCSASIYSLNPGRYASGIVFQPAPSNSDAELVALYPYGSSSGPELDNKQYFAPVPVGSAAGANVAFNLETHCGLTPLYVPADEASNVKKRRFILGFQGGFDGQSPSVPVLVGNDILPTNQQGLDCSTNTSRGSYAYKQAVASLSNADEWDFNLITTPGINHDDHPYVAGLVVDMCERRGDCFYIMDISHNQLAGDAAIQNVVDLAAQYDSNYVATYYPWVKVSETNTNRVIAVPPSVVMMAVFAANDKVAAEWFAPAGLNRGGIPTAVQVADRLTHSERDTLYEGKVNPIAAFPGQGIVAWGQKTLQRTPSALDRINVRRLLIALKKFIASSSRFLVFEQNVSATRQRFLNIVNPYLEGVQQRSGVYAFKVIMDESNNTPDLVDRGILYGQIYIQPTRTAEMIVLDFNVMPTGASFPGA
jgi:hypothetical protein